MKKSRNCTTRTRGGCVTCKRRRRKCDERRPACKACTSSGRTCEGFIDPFRNALNVAYTASVANIPLLPTDGERCESRIASFKYLAGAIFGHLNYELLEGVLGRSVSQPVIKHALLALSVQLKAFACDHRNRFVSPSDIEFSLRRYGQSIRGVQEALYGDMQTTQRIEMLFALSLVISYEILRGNGPAALLHLRGALHLLPGSLMASSRHSEDSAILEQLRLLYLQLEVGALSFAGALSSTMSTAVFDHVSKTANHEIWRPGITEASLLQAIRAKFICLKFCGLQALKCSKTAADTRLALLKELRSWFKLFSPVLDTMTGPSQISSSTRDPASRECRFLYIHYLVLTMRLSSFCPEPCETWFDSFGASFNAIITHAKALIDRGQHLLFTLGMGLVEPLYITVLKCREPQKRLAALELLQMCRQEGAWDGPLMACIAEHVIRVEATLSGHGQHDDVVPMSADAGLLDSAEAIWDLRTESDAEQRRIFAASLPSIHWQKRSALVDFHHPRGKVQALCSI